MKTDLSTNEVGPVSGAGGALLLFFLILVAALCGIAVGGLRWVVSFFPGMQGMLFGGVLGYAFGVPGRGRTAGFWRPGQRFWLWLNVTLTFVLAMLLALSFLYAAPLAGPLDWLSGVVRGSTGEPYFGPVPLNPQAGRLSEGAWLFFNALDTLFFFLLGLLTLGVSATKGEPEGDEDEEAEEVEAVPVLGRSSSLVPIARRFFVVQWVLLLAAGIGLGVWDARGSRSTARLDAQSRRERMAELQALGGRYEFDDGRHLMGPPGSAGAFVLRPMGYDVLVGFSIPEGTYALRLEHRGRHFAGRLERGGLPVPLRARFEPDGRLRLAGRVQLAGGVSQDVVIEARRSAP